VEQKVREMVKIYFVVLVLAGLSLASVAHGHNEVDAGGVQLAISHFDPDRQIGLKANGPEVVFMSAALRFIREEVPETRVFRFRRESQPWSIVRAPILGKSLILKDKEGGHNKLAPAEEAVAIAEEIGEGCLAGLRIFENPMYSDGGSWTYRSTFRHFFDVQEHNEISDNCANLPVVKWLYSSGVSGVLLVEQNWPHSSSAKLYLEFREYVDLQFTANVLQENPLYSEVFESYSLEPYWENGIWGPGNTAETIRDPEYADYGGVVIKFEYESGGGSALENDVKRKRHYWVVFIRAMGTTDRGEWRFKIDKVEEGGDYLTMESRKRLSR
jgi:hypothetical protein